MRVIAQRNAPPNWKSNPQFVAIGRGTLWGNPYPLHQTCSHCGQIHSRKGSTLECYYDHLINLIEDYDNYIELTCLIDKILVCPGNCKPRPCHGDIIRELCKAQYL